MQRFACLSLLLMSLGCSSGVRDLGLGAFSIEAQADAIIVRHDAGLELRTVPGASFAFGRATATYRTDVGAFQLSEVVDQSPRSAVRVGGFEEREAGVWVAKLEDEAGVQLGTLSARLRGELLELAARPLDAEQNRVLARWVCDEGPMMGFGAQTHANDHRGEVVPVWVSEQGIGKTMTNAVPDFWPLVGSLHQSYLPLPTLFAPRGGVSYGLHAATERHSIWDLCATDPGVLSISVWGPEQVLEIAPGPGPRDVITQQTSQRGRIPLGPEWTHGVWMERIGGTQAVRDEVTLLRAEGVPFSAMWSEDWRGAEQQGRSYVLEEDWRLDTRLYPDFAGLLQALEEDGVKFMTYFNTFVVKDVDVWAEFSSRKLLVEKPDGEPYLFTGPSFEPTGLADLFDPEGAAFVQRELEQALALGVDGWMADFAEWYPAGAPEVLPSGGLDPEEAHHAYTVAWAQLNQAAIRASGRSDVVVYHRSGYSGAQGLIPVVWAGDQRTTFDADDGLPTIVPILTGLGLGGFPIATHDIAGYTSATNPPATKELFFRWTALGALGPVMRTHHGRDAALNWRWSRDAETRAHFKRWAELHARLFPVWRALAQEASETGLPVLRAPALFDPASRNLDAVADAYFVGEQLYVAPVLTASTSARRVIFPRGVFHDFFRPGVRYSGEARVEAPRTEIPVFAPAGAIVPMLPRAFETTNRHPTRLDLDDLRWSRAVHVFLGAAGRAREFTGGAYVLASPGAVSAVRGIEPAAAFTGTSSATVSLGTARKLTVTDSEGRPHVLELEGVDSRLAVDVIVRW